MRLVLLLAAATLAFAPGEAGAQARPHPVGATRPRLGDSPDTLPPAPPTVPREARGDGCSTLDKVGALAIAPALTGAVGWLMGGIIFYGAGGVLASDTDDPGFRRTRRRFLRTGAALGAGAGLVFGVRHVVEGCPAPGRPDGPPRRR